MLECLEGHKADQTYEYEYAQDADPGHSCRIVGDLLLVKRWACQPAKDSALVLEAFPLKRSCTRCRYFNLPIACPSPLRAQDRSLMVEALTDGLNQRRSRRSRPSKTYHLTCCGTLVDAATAIDCASTRFNANTIHRAHIRCQSLHRA